MNKEEVKQAYWAMPAKEVLEKLGSSEMGLSNEEAEDRLKKSVKKLI